MVVFTAFLYSWPIHEKIDCKKREPVGGTEKIVAMYSAMLLQAAYVLNPGNWPLQVLKQCARTVLESCIPLFMMVTLQQWLESLPNLVKIEVTLHLSFNKASGENGDMPPTIEVATHKKITGTITVRSSRLKAANPVWFSCIGRLFEVWLTLGSWLLFFIIFSLMMRRCKIIATLHCRTQEQST